MRCGQPLCQAGSCCHLLASHYAQVKRFFLLCFFPWKISRVKTHWKKVMHLLPNQERFLVCDFRFSHSSLNTHGPYYCTFPFLSLFSSDSRARGRPDAFASLDGQTASENTWVNHIFHEFPSQLKSGWNGISMFRCGQQWDCLREKKKLRILLWKHKVLVGLV